jgi:general L-amino acid transport system permease protein
VAFAGACGLDRLRHPRVALGGLIAAVLAWLWLSAGGIGLTRVASENWGGLTLTIGVAVAALAAAVALAIPLALARRGHRRALALPARIVIEIFRSVPLVALLLSSDLLIPMLLPPAWQVAKLWRVGAAIVGLAAVNLAEVLRGALDAIPAGQTEAARALGLTRPQAFRLVALPQAARIALPAAINVFVGAIKDTSLVLVVGILDVTGAAKAALADPAWQAYAPEMYLFLAAIYILLCVPFTQFGRRLSRQTKRPSAPNKRSISAGSL